MKPLLFFDDWMLRNREGFDRKVEQPEPIKEIILESRPELSLTKTVIPIISELFRKVRWH